MRTGTTASHSRANVHSVEGARCEANMNAVAGVRREKPTRALAAATTIAFLALVLWAFARTYYLKLLFDTPALPVLLHVHGLVMSGWVALLVTQTTLIAAHRVRWHRRLGVIGIAWAALVVAMGSIVTIGAAARDVRAASPLGPVHVTIMGLELLQMAFFAAFVATAIAYRQRRDIHGRLMLMTIVCMLPSAITRLPFDFIGNREVMFALDLAVIGAIAFDTWRGRRLHPALAWAGAAFLAAMNVAFFVFQTPAFVRFGSALVA
jgi:hypothetical protein